MTARPTTTPEVLAREAALPGFTLRQLRHDRSAGQSLALALRGVRCAHGDYRRDDRRRLPERSAIHSGARRCAGRGRREAAGIAAGQRLKRRDSKAKQLASRFANALRGAILKDNTRDSGCGLKAVRTEIMRRLPFFNGTHRFLPALVIQEGYHGGALRRGRPARGGTANRITAFWTADCAAPSTCSASGGSASGERSCRG
jgi:dolichol-phosphate mannosyltransferase